MDFSAVRRVRDGLAELIGAINSGGASTAEARRVLSESKAFAAQVAVLQADAAALAAAGERHGDGGAGVLAQAAGLSRHDAASQVKTVQQLESMPGVRDALTGGDIPLANVKSLARASAQTTATQVEHDDTLLSKAASLSPERFARETTRWVAQRQHDDGEAEYRRQRARRRLSFWKGDDGMVHLRGELDPVTGTKIHKRFLQEAERLRRHDINRPHGEQRSWSQRLADSLDTLTADGSRKDSRGGGSAADITIVQHLSAEGDKAFAEVAGGAAIPQAVLEQHFCNAKIVGIVFSGEGLPLWRGTALARPSRAQMDALIARYGGCGGCEEHSVACQAHHIRPRSQGGPTDIDNLMPLCWRCHDNVHLHGWQAVADGDRHTIAPPERIRYGPARAPDPPPIHSPPRHRRRRTPASAKSEPQPLLLC